jgi:CheY-like chemotaxis protein
MESLGRLAAGMAHQFNNLLAIIIGNAELLDQAVKGDAEAITALAGIHLASERGADYTLKLLAFASSQQLEMKATNCNEFMDTLYVDIRNLLSDDVELILHIPAELCLAMVDRRLLKQVMLDLTVHAQESMHHAGIMTVCVELLSTTDPRIPALAIPGPCGYLLFSISDTGSGMSEESLTRAFEPQFTPKSAGWGLGLATCYGVIKQSGGSIWITSPAGEGTTVSFCLPAIQPVEVAGELECRPPYYDGSEAVLVLEEDPLVRDITVKSLIRHGYKSTSPANREDAVRILNSESAQFDLIVADGTMLFMGEKSLSPYVKKVGSRIPVIVASGYGEELFKRQLTGFPNAVFLQKPFSSRKLLTTVRRVLNA